MGITSFRIVSALTCSCGWGACRSCQTVIWRSALLHPFLHSIIVLQLPCRVLFSVRTVAVQNEQHDNVAVDASQFPCLFLHQFKHIEFWQSPFTFSSSDIWDCPDQKKTAASYVRFSMLTSHWIPIKKAPLLFDLPAFQRAYQNCADWLVFFS